MNRILLILLFLQTSFAMDSSIEAALRCIEKKKMNVLAVEKIDGKVYARGWFSRTKDNVCYRITHDAPFFEIKKNCSFEEKHWFKKIEDIEPHNKLNRLSGMGRKGLLVALQNYNGDSVYVIEKNKVLWACPLEKDDDFVFEFLDKNRLMVSTQNSRKGDGAPIKLLDNKCQWTLFEKNARLHKARLYHTEQTTGSRFVDYRIKHEPYLVFFDSLYNKHWGTSSSFGISVSTRNIACGITDYMTDYELDNSKKMIKCIKWTGSNFVEEILPHKIDFVRADGCLCSCSHAAERLFPCGEGICMQNYETRKIKILVE